MGYGWRSKPVNLEDLKGCVFKSIAGMETDSEEVVFKLDTGIEFKMYHEQDGCESVYLADVCGDVEDLLDAEVIFFQDRTEYGDSDYGTFTHTFYDIQTTKGCVNLRWIGESNGYYSQSVSIKYPED